jgi:signal transduction histidine kinase
MSIPLRILFVEDSEDDVTLLLRELRRGDYDPRMARVDSAEALRSALVNEEWDIVISDYAMPSFNGLHALAIHLQTAPELPFILISGTVGEQMAVESIKAGANDYLMKDNLLRFLPAVNRALREAAERRTHRRAVVSLRESQTMLSLIYNSTSDMLALFSVLPDDSYRIASANQSIQEFARQSLDGASSLIGKRLEEMSASMFHLAPDSIATLRQHCDAAMREGRPISYEAVFDLPTRRMHVELNLVPVSNPESGGQHLLWACRDISSRKEAEERQRSLETQLQQSKKLEALGQLAGGIAHDFNNLLTGILGYGELIKAKCAHDLGTLGQIEQILHASHRAKDLVRQILAFSRREPLDRKPIFVEPIVKEALNLIRASSPPGVHIESFLMPDMLPILGDPTQIHQVLINLCTNAVQAMGEHGRLSLSLETVNVDTAFARNHPPLHEGEFIRLSVSDTGAGLTSSAMEHLFEPFFTTKPPGSGTGLGLAVVHGIVRSHEGTISVYSRASEGTTFQVYFPVCGILPDSKPPSNAAIPRGNGEQILFVDDEAGIVALATTFLEQLGYRPLSFTHADEALENFAADPHAFAAVITDLTMPKMTGAELATSIHELRPDIPIILTSGYSGAIDEERAVRSGFTEILGKPFAFRTLAESLHRALEKQALALTH